MLSVTYGYARLGEVDDDARNLETHLWILADHGIREDLIFSDVAGGQNMNRTGWTELMPLVQPRDTIVIAFLDRFSRNFEEGSPHPGGVDRARHRHRRAPGER